MDYTILSEFYSKTIFGHDNHGADRNDYKLFITIANPVRLWIGDVSSVQTTI